MRIINYISFDHGTNEIRHLCGRKNIKTGKENILSGRVGKQVVLIRPSNIILLRSMIRLNLYQSIRHGRC